MLTIHLSALSENYRLLKARHSAHTLACVVKADAYGLGAAIVSDALYAEACRLFCVATLEEGIQLRPHLPKDAEIIVFQGIFAGEEKEYTAHQLTPVINTPEQLSRMTDGGWRIKPVLHIDTGMTRLGLTHTELEAFLCRHPSSAIRFLMSHLACADDSAHPKNTEQLERFNAARALLPQATASLANSAGIFLAPEFHFDIARPGCALYGIEPAFTRHGLKPVVSWSARILQIRTLDRDETVGYGGTYDLTEGGRLAIVACGYADGYLRSASNQAHAFIGGHAVPVAGRVSMDMIALDVSTLPEAVLAEAREAELLNGFYTVNDLASDSGTIGYELFTRIGARVKRVYR